MDQFFLKHLCTSLHNDFVKSVLLMIHTPSKYIRAELLSSKEFETQFEAFKKFYKFIQKQSGTDVMTVRADNEWDTNRMKDYCDQEGIELKLTTPGHSSSNPQAESMNRAISQLARNILVASNLPVKLYGQLILTAIFLHNRTVQAQLGNKSPFELIYKHKPRLDMEYGIISHRYHTYKAMTLQNSFLIRVYIPD